MSGTGPARPSLTAQLQEKLTQDRQEIEALTLNELRKLAESLSAASRAALEAMESDTAIRLDATRRRMEAIERRQRRWPLWTALSSAVVALAAFASLWTATSWARSDLNAALTERRSARMVLDMLRDETKGVTLQAGNGRMFLVGPEGSAANVCNGRPCLELPE